MYSFHFNGIDLYDYGLVVTKHTFHNLDMRFERVQIPGWDGIYTPKSSLRPRLLTLEIAVVADDIDDLQTKLDNIKRTIITRETKQLIIQVQDGRYYNAKFEAFPAMEYKGGTLAIGEIDFICPDVYAYDVSETNVSDTINASPFEKDVTVGGTAFTWPTITLTSPGVIAQGVEIKVENVQTEDELIYTVPAGGLILNDVLLIDCEHWIVYLNGTASMAGVSGRFPYLAVGLNTMRFTNFTGGGLLIDYRKRYL